MAVFDVRKIDTDLPPPGIYQFEARVVPGNAGPDGMLKVTKTNQRQLMVALECTRAGMG
jgi:hypothetical protein